VVLRDLSREAPERAGVLSVAVGSRHPVRQLGACCRPCEMIVEVGAEHAGLGLPGVTGDVRPIHDSSSLADDLAVLRVPCGPASVSPGRRMPSPCRPLRDAGLEGPEPQLGAAGDEVGGGVLVQVDATVVGLAAESGGLEQRADVAGVADELAGGVGVGHEVAHYGLSGQRGRAVLGGEQDHGVVEHGRAAVDLLVGRRVSAVAVVDAADGGGDELDVDLGLLGCGLDLIELGGVYPVGDQDADLAAGEIFRNKDEGCIKVVLQP